MRKLLILSLLMCIGCEQEVAEEPVKKPKSRWAKGTDAAAKEKSKGGTYIADDGPRRSKAVPRKGATIRNSGGGGYAGGSSGSSGYASASYNGAPRSEGQAVDTIAKSMRESLELGPTLVVWVFDRTESASRLVSSSLTAIKSLYGGEEFAKASNEEKLLTAMVGFGEQTDFLVDPPTGDVAAVKSALDLVRTDSGSREATYAALKLTLEKFLPQRKKEGREVLIVLVTDEPGDDSVLLDDVASVAAKNAIPIFVIGPSAPLGKNPPPAKDAQGKPLPMGNDPRSPSPDTYSPDWVSFDTGYGPPEVYESSLGPWPLERLCRESSGAYLAVGSSGSSPYGNRVDPKVMEKYAPEYLPLAEMQAAATENKCRSALAAAANMQGVKAVLLNPQLFFPKGNNEAQMKTMIDKAQLPAALLEGDLNKLYDALAAGEGDRAKVKDLRTQVAFGTAMGRVAAAKVRVDGYNAMLAALKRGKTFMNPSSTSWVLEPSEKIETGSVLQKLADKAKANLEGVMKNHPNTPWARLAEQELRTPLGWTWKEQ